MAEQRILVCSPADAPRSIPGAVYDKHCARCGQRVMMAPSGQGYLKRWPEAEIICYDCLKKIDPAIMAESRSELAAPAEQIAQEVIDSGPNQWRNRN